MKEKNTKLPIAVALATLVALGGYAIYSGMHNGGGLVGSATSDTSNTKPAESPRIDVVFAVDATGSMADEIEVVRKQLVSMADELAAGKPKPDIRFGLILYKDLGDDFVTKKTDLTRDVQTVRTLLQNIEVDGGGDHPEHVGRALDEALGLSWDRSDDASRIIYLVGDAPGHGKESDFTVTRGIESASQMGIKIHTIGCSGIENQGGKRQFTAIAQRAGGTFEELTYHAVVQGQDGKDKSVIYHGGEVLEAEEVLRDDEWAEGAAGLRKSGKVKPAKERTRRKARSAPKRNNLDKAMFKSIQGEAESKGVKYDK